MSIKITDDQRCVVDAIIVANMDRCSGKLNRKAILQETMHQGKLNGLNITDLTAAHVQRAMTELAKEKVWLN